MKIKSEFDLIRKIASRIESKGNSELSDSAVSIGDDCFAYKISDNRYGLISTDMSVEDVHFKKVWAAPEQIGYKVMAGNISDISAMGGIPRFAFVSIGIPENISEEYVLSLYDGMIHAANISGTVLSGGDTVLSEKIVISISIYGETINFPISRNGAAAEEFIYVTGNIGSSKAGLQILESEKKDLEVLMNKHPQLIQKHLMPDIRSSVVKHILDEFSPSSMIDISDGLLSDLNHICVSSKTGFELYADNFPVTEDLKSYCNEKGLNLIDIPLESGEEYELLFTSKKDVSNTNLNEIQITKIGKIIDEKFYIVNSGIRKMISIKGYDHFKLKEGICSQELI